MMEEEIELLSMHIQRLFWVLLLFDICCLFVLLLCSLGFVSLGVQGY